MAGRGKRDPQSRSSWVLPSGPVRVGLPGYERGLRSHVHEAAGDELTIAAPVEAPEAEPLPVGGQLWLSWASDRGLHHLKVQLRERLGDPARWRVLAVGPPEREQRREGYRVPLMGTVRLRMDETWQEAQLIDLSEGGLRCLLALDAVVEEGATCEIDLEVVREGLRLSGEVVRVREGVDGRPDVGVRFVGASTAVTDELRRYVFDVQLEHRRIDPW